LALDEWRPDFKGLPQSWHADENEARPGTGGRQQSHGCNCPRRHTFGDLGTDAQWGARKATMAMLGILKHGVKRENAPLFEKMESIERCGDSVPLTPVFWVQWRRKKGVQLSVPLALWGEILSYPSETRRHRFTNRLLARSGYNMKQNQDVASGRKAKISADCRLFGKDSIF